ncbi:MAG: hypothetical protein OXG36_17165 [Caldilineaceae bacterium]|nr:hypothetical protein [Caldilineaceae bacterium]
MSLICSEMEIRSSPVPALIRNTDGDGFLNVCVYQDVCVGKQHVESPPTLDTDLIILRVEHPEPVEVNSGTDMNPANGDQLKGWLLRWLATIQSIVQHSGNEGAYADTVGFGRPAYLLRELLVKGNCGSHDALASPVFINASMVPTRDQGPKVTLAHRVVIFLSPFQRHPGEL